MATNTSPLPRFRMAIERGSLLQAEAAARELDRLGLDDALALVLLILRERDSRYQRAALRFLGRVLVECPQVTFEIADGLLDGLAELEGVDCDVARSRLALGLHGAGLRRGAAYVARSDDLR